MRRIDRIVLEGTGKDMQDQPARDRVLDVMMRRFDALLPYRDALRSISRGFERDPLGMLALNQQGLNSCAICSKPRASRTMARWAR